jgi:hypothetical protein
MSMILILYISQWPLQLKAPKYLSIYVLLFQFRMASKTKKVIKAHGRYMKAQEDLKRQALQFLIFKQLLPSY